MTHELIRTNPFEYAFEVSQDGPARTLFTGLNLQIRENEFLVILGPSGCGKSTLLRLLGGLLQPTRGLIERSRVSVSYVFQEACLLPWLTVDENLCLAPALSHTARPTAENLARSLRQVHLAPDVGRLYPWQLSGGMKMRVALARALGQNVSCYLFDEPFSALDEQVRERLQDDLRQIFVTRQTSFVFVTHLLSEALTLADRIIILNDDGRLRAEVMVPRDIARDPGFRDSAEFAREMASLRKLARGDK